MVLRLDPPPKVPPCTVKFTLDGEACERHTGDVIGDFRVVGLSAESIALEAATDGPRGSLIARVSCPECGPTELYRRLGPLRGGIPEAVGETLKTIALPVTSVVSVFLLGVVYVGKLIQSGPDTAWKEANKLAKILKDGWLPHWLFGW